MLELLTLLINKVKDIAYKVGLIADYVVERGTATKNGATWNYRKWYSGDAECWGTLTETKTHYTTVNNFPGYYGYMYFPEDLFNKPPNTQYVGKIGNGFTMTGLGARQDSKDFFVYYFLGTVSGTYDVRLEAQVKGTWK